MNSVRHSLHIETDSMDMSDVDEMKDGGKKLADTAYTLTGYASSLYVKTAQLSDSPAIRAEAQMIASISNELYNNLLDLKNKTKDMETKITDKINEVIDPLSKNPQKIKSFASDKNTDIERVQFVIHTKAVEVEEPEEEEKPPEKELNFFERILALFGLA